jgi:hypothetical protein
MNSARNSEEREEPMPVVDLSDHPIVKTAYGRWQPLNGPLGVAGFGISAIVCDPGEEFDIEHDETDSGQQEVYVVVAGRATFTIGDEQLEAGPDPAAVRSYGALEPGTRIVCIGGAGADPGYGTWISDAAEG